MLCIAQKASSARPSQRRPLVVGRGRGAEAVSRIINSMARQGLDSKKKNAINMQNDEQSNDDDNNDGDNDVVDDGGFCYSCRILWID